MAGSRKVVTFKNSTIVEAATPRATANNSHNDNDDDVFAIDNYDYMDEQITSSSFSAAAINPVSPRDVGNDHQDEEFLAGQQTASLNSLETPLQR